MLVGNKGLRAMQDDVYTQRRGPIVVPLYIAAITASLLAGAVWR